MSKKHKNDNNVLYDANKEVSQTKKITKEILSKEQFKNNVEKHRLDFKKKNTLFSSLTYSTIGISILCFIIVLFLTTLPSVTKDEKLKWLVLIPICIGFVTIVVYFICNKFLKDKYVTDSGEIYQNEYSKILINYEYSDIEEVKEYNFLYNGIISTHELIEMEVFESIAKDTSRNLMETKINNKNFKMVDCAIGIPHVSETISKKSLGVNDKKTEKAKSVLDFVAGFYGRIYNYDYRLNDDQKIIFIISSDYTYSPTNRKNLRRYASYDFNLRENIIPFSSDKELIQTFLKNEKIVDLLNSLEANDRFLGGFISLTANGLYIGFNLNDEVLELPIKNPVNIEDIHLLRSLDKKVIDFINLLS